MRKPLALIAALAACPFITACGGSGGGATAGADTADAASDAQAAASDAQPVAAQASTPESVPNEPATGQPSAAAPGNALAESGQGDGQDAATAEAQAAPAEDELTTDLLLTAEGAMKFWVKSMGEAKFYSVLFATDAGSSTYPTLEQYADAFEQTEGEDSQKKMIRMILKMAFNDPWVDATVELETLQEPRARFKITLNDDRVVHADVNQSAGLWKVIVTDKMLQPAKVDPNITAPPPAPPPAK